ncbi:MAG: thioesterase family protein [Acidimicrobiales bacterium]
MRASLDPSRDPADYRFTHTIRARFAETDAMGIVHHAAYLPYLEEARVALLRDLGRPYTVLRAEGIDFTVLEVAIRYRMPARFDDEIVVHVAVGAVTRTTFQIAYLLTVDGATAATAVTVHGCVNPDGRPMRMPAWIAAEVS